LFHEIFRWLQDDLGRTAEADSWAMQFRVSLNLWGLTEATHVLTLMVFAGTIWLIDLKMLGVAFRGTPFSRLNERVLPLTVISMVVMLFTGVLLFLAKPMEYYHNVWFRIKIVFLIIAFINIWVFHNKVQHGSGDWDNSPNPPRAVKLSGAISLTSWALIIVFGRFIAYDWFNCGKPQPDIINVLAECAAYPGGIVKEEIALSEPFEAASLIPATATEGGAR